MNNDLSRFRTFGVLAVLALSCTLFLAALGPGVAGQPGTSPLSPVPASGLSSGLGSSLSLVSRLRSRLEQILDRSFWTSPLPWAAIGLILFSMLASALVRNLRRDRSARAGSEDRSQPLR